MHSEEYPEYFAAEDGSWVEVGSPLRQWTYEELVEAIDMWKIRWQAERNKVISLEAHL